jgi:hypothetical protein
MVEVRPDPKPVKREKRPRRTFRFRATREEWAEIIAVKRGPCRVCDRSYVRTSYHHLVPRSLGGDDVADNIAPLCGDGTTGCHERVEARNQVALQLLAASLTEGEYAYVVGKLGEGAMGRLFGV